MLAAQRFARAVPPSRLAPSRAGLLPCSSGVGARSGFPVATSIIDLASWLGLLGRLGVIGTPLEGVGWVLSAVPRDHHFVTNLAGRRILVAGWGAIDFRFIHRVAMRACEVFAGAGLPSSYHLRNMCQVGIYCQSGTLCGGFEALTDS
jgi:hypothetical protein